MTPAPFYADMARGPDGGQAFWLRTADGVRIRMGIWPAPPSARGTVFLLPGRTEYIEKYGPAAADFAARGFATLAIDWRGQGLADRALEDRMKGHVSHFDAFQSDLDEVIENAALLGLPRPWFVVGHSMGGAIALRRIMDGSPFAACAFSAPMFGLKLPPPLHLIRKPLAKLIRQMRLTGLFPPGMGPECYVLKTRFEDNLLTKDREMWAFLVDHVTRVPKLALGGPTLGWAAESVLECDRLAMRPAPDMHCYCSVGTDERIIDVAAVDYRMRGWRRGVLDWIDGAEHEVMMDSAARRKQFFDGCVAAFEKAL
ncbi:alpha/beta hydrolase [Thioclava litoralis]|uniref:Alpha/beta hydrolase n=1 Tax=Thioclava litoralis TaxID=3076557 RepID=A0ABZ1DW98_9RHOB|nr:alpha/beta hydrolase [Thioclava sp. FTW29]